MYISSMFKRLCIIPARGGSKRIPGKNTRSFLGKPILHYSIEVAITSGLFDEVMVSTDDDLIAKEAREAGAVVPFLRTATNAGDYATTAEVLKEVLETYEAQGVSFHEICCLYPTAVFTQPFHLRKGWSMLQDDADVVYPILSFGYPVWRAVQKNNEERVAMVWPEHAERRSQDLTPLYHDAGQWYWLKVKAFLATGKILSGRAKGLEVSRLEAQDIDDLEDWELAELKYQRLLRLKGKEPEAENKSDALVFSPVTLTHGALLLQWRNDPETRLQSVQNEPISEDTHWTWLERKLQDANCKMCMAWVGEKMVGVVRADCDEEGWWWLSWTVAPEFRGKGWGKIMVKNWVNLLKSKPLKAMVRTTNLSSARIAIHAEFEPWTLEGEFQVFAKNQTNI